MHNKCMGLYGNLASAVADVIAQRVNDACSKKPLESKFKELQDKYKTPQNCKFLGP